METTIDELNGTVTFKVNDKVEYTVKVTWQFVHDVEAKVASMTTLLNKISMYAMTQHDIAMMLVLGTKASKQAVKYEEASQIIFEQGVDKFLEGIAEIIKFSTGGSKNWKDFKEASVAEQQIKNAEEDSEKK